MIGADRGRGTTHLARNREIYVRDHRNDAHRRQDPKNRAWN
jgi:hypothetical protein